MTLSEHIRSGRVDRQRADHALVDLLSELIRIPSPTGSEGQLAAYLAELLGSLGWHEVSVDQGQDVVARLHGAEPGPTVMFLAHSDTSPIVEMQQLEPRIEQGNRFDKRGSVLVGKGAVAPKGTLASMIIAIDWFYARESAFKGQLVFAAVSRDLFANGDGMRDLLHRGSRPTV